MKRSGDWSPLLKSDRQIWRPKTSNLETDGHPIQQSMATKMAIMNRHQPAIMIDSSSSILFIERFTKYDDNFTTITTS
ncbi:hypothetical protein DERF_010792 [Dermatophagoides farinae]|uniref:Uncharacterized protein n=1 Tax=Dermatophagoides farinae TaxID=6954 RepID=A0A922HU45_DERFA|nr:hypothetical protein DERF_010792 [Dermatophagoides farinae]